MAARQKEKEEARALAKKKELEEKKKEHLRKVSVIERCVHTLYSSLIDMCDSYTSFEFTSVLHHTTFI